MDWQPIETAPIGPEFLAYDPVARKFDVCTREPDGVNVRGEPYRWVYQTQCDGDYGPDDDDFQGGRATHWMSLPAAPAASLAELNREARELGLDD